MSSFLSPFSFFSLCTHHLQWMESLVNKVNCKLHDSPRGDMAVLFLLSNVLHFLIRSHMKQKPLQTGIFAKLESEQEKDFSSKRGIFLCNFLGMLSRPVKASWKSKEHSYAWHIKSSRQNNFSLFLEEAWDTVRRAIS